MTEKKPDYLGHRVRLRQRFLNGEGRDMADYELLELVLTMAIPQRDVKPLAKILIAEFGSFAGVLNASNENLLNVNGIKENTLTMLKVIKASALRMSWQNLTATDEPILNNTDVLIDYCRAAMSFSEVEEFRIIFLDSKLRVMAQEVQQRGTINQVAIHPREVIKAAMAKKARAIILVHNHPSGDVTPSKADVEITMRIKEAAKAVDIELFDHLIISKNDAFSFSTHCII